MKPFLARAAAALAVFATIAVLPSLWRPTLRLDEARERREEATSALFSGDGRKALELLGKLRQAFPENPHYIQLEADAHKLLGDWEAEAASWELFLHISPRLKGACPRLVEVYRELKQPEAVKRAERLCSQIGSGP